MSTLPTMTRNFVPATAAFLCIAILAASGCGTPGPGSQGRTRPGDAQDAYLSGRYLAAAAGFQELTLRQPELANHWWFRTADAAWLGGDPGLAADAMRRVDTARLSPSDRPLAELLKFATGPQVATPIEILGSLDFAPDRLPERYRDLYHRIRGEALRASGQPYASALQRLRLGERILDPDLARRNRLAILDALQELSVQQLRSLIRRHDPEDEMYGWLALVATSKSAVFGDRPIREAVSAWQERFPEHPANLEAVRALVAAYDVRINRPDRIGLILPLSGNLAAAGQSIQDGFMAAYFSSSQQAQIQVYDTKSDPGTALAMYRRALAEGAGAVVGPLDKDSVAAVLVEADGRVPLLALNYPTRQVPALPGVYQFGLLPDDDAYAVAERMLTDGRVRAVVLSPGSTWGDRMAEAFAERFESLGGVVYQKAAYQEESVDFSPLIESVIGIDASQGRRRELQSQLGIPLGFVPQMRHDLDALFMAARPREGRLIKPQLAFHNAGALAVYATSHVYSGVVDPTANRDLNQVRFCDAPWLLGSQDFKLELEGTRELFESARGARARLFATGYDAFGILPYLDWLSGLPGDGFPGTTGQLVVDADGIVRRRLDCAEFRDGRPRPLEGPGVETTGS